LGATKENKDDACFSPEKKKENYITRSMLGNAQNDDFIKQFDSFHLGANEETKTF